MDVAVFGLGYVGVVSAVCLAEAGHRVIGVDINGAKVDMVNRGESPIVEPEVDALLKRALAGGRLRATCDARDAIASAQTVWVCVSTPSQSNGHLDSRFLARVSEQIGAAMRHDRARRVVVVRSTTLPGTTRNVVIPILERTSGMIAGESFGVCYHPEFLREGSSVEDFQHPSKIVVGATDPVSRDVLLSLYTTSNATPVACAIEMAELTKYADNAWHALKVAFANEIGTLCKGMGMDGRTAMEIFCADRKLNLSEKYLRPGFAFGGSCLPKDLRALTYEGRRLDLELPLLGAILPSNLRHVDRAMEMILRREGRRVALLGLSFKPGTDDLRESPLVELAERLIGKGYQLRIFDASVNLSMVVGANRRYIEARIPHIAQVFVQCAEEAVKHADTVVIGYRDPVFAAAITALPTGSSIIDLAGLDDLDPEARVYDGICW